LLLAFLVEKSRFFGGVLIAEMESTFGICSNRHFAPFPLLEFAQIVILPHFHFWNLLKSSFCSISTFGICSNHRFGTGDERLFTSHAATGKGNSFADRCGQIEERQAAPDQSPVFLSRL